MHENWSVPWQLSKLLESVGISLSLQETDHPKKWRNAAASRLELLKPRIPKLTLSSNAFEWPCRSWSFFPPYKPNPTNKTLLVSHYFIVISKEDVWENIPWFHQSSPSQLAPNMPRTLRRCIFITFIFHWRGGCSCRTESSPEIWHCERLQRRCFPDNYILKSRVNRYFCCISP